jgi:cyclopropane fatty-acyl-phospholipid synthase-like methyltransferase
MINITIGSIIQYLYRKNYNKLIKKLSIKENELFLDIGSGSGFLKPLVVSAGGHYIGIEARREFVENAKDRYGSEGFILGFFPDDFNYSEKMEGGNIVSLTTVDEIANKKRFLQAIHNMADTNTKIFIATRNRDWIFSKKNKIITKKGENIDDLSIAEYKSLFNSYEFEVTKIEKNSRPIITSFTLTGLKGFIIVILEKFLPLDKCYMIGYHIKKRKGND